MRSKEPHTLIAIFIVMYGLLSKRAGTSYFWHGTSSKKLTEIIQHGLDPNPPDKAYSSGKHETLPGAVYLANNFDTAWKAAENAASNFGGNPAIVIVSIDPGMSTELDEDHFPQPSRVVLRLVKGIPAPEEYPGYEEKVTDHIVDFFKNFAPGVPKDYIEDERETIRDVVRKELKLWPMLLKKEDMKSATIEYRKSLQEALERLSFLADYPKEELSVRHKKKVPVVFAAEYKTNRYKAIEDGHFDEWDIRVNGSALHLFLSQLKGPVKVMQGEKVILDKSK